MPEKPRLQIQAWDPSFGAEVGFEAEEEGFATEVDPGVELPARDWTALRPPATPREALFFIDGVRRIDARASLHKDSSGPVPLLLASLASGVCQCRDRATLESLRVTRLLLAPPGVDAEEISLSFGTYRLQAVEEPGLPGLLNGLRQALREHERETARELPGSGLVIVDGPLTGTAEQHPDHLIGYVKSHHTSYLRGPAETVLQGLLPLERTPLFRIEGAWPRYSCYLRLPAGGKTDLWSALCRLEFSARLPIQQVIDCADRTAGQLPRFASAPHRESRAPQNLYPISGLEQQLRNRLGDPLVVLREILRKTG